MPYLGNFLGQLLAEIAIARMQADLETVRLAELYGAHPLLRTMPVPHVRLPEIDLDIPVLIRTSEEPGADESPRGGATLDAMSRKFDEILPEHLSRAGIELSDGDRARLRRALDESIRSAEMPQEISGDVRRLADNLTLTTLRLIEELQPSMAAPEPSAPDAPEPTDAPEPSIPGALADGLKEAARLEFLKLRGAPPRLVVLVTSSELREIGSAENVTRLRLKVAEEGLEWAMVESDGIERDRLVPE